MNLLHETVEAIAENGHQPDQIIFIGSETSGHSCTWSEFEKLADREYDPFMGQEVAGDLIIVFDDLTKLWRMECDGEGWWEYSKPFKMPEVLKPIQALFSSKSSPHFIRELSELNEGD
jgi:hypothetical protein